MLECISVVVATRQPWPHVERVTWSCTELGYRVEVVAEGETLTADIVEDDEIEFLLTHSPTVYLRGDWFQFGPGEDGETFVTSSALRRVPHS